MAPGAGARWAAGLVALLGFVGLAVRTIAALEQSGSLGGALWAMLRYFTIIGNLGTALILAALALGCRRVRSPMLLGGVALNMALIGIVYVLLLRGLLHLSGAALLADRLLHDVAPPLVVLFWLVFAPKQGLRWRDPPLWALPPLIYFPYGLLRGALEGKYPYPFMDVSQLGWTRALLNAAVIALVFLIAGYGLVWLGRRLASKGC